jgi:acyl-CoA synthetase (AMP-forming)/AMP-acid ligase II
MSRRSPHPDVTIPEVPLPEFVLGRAAGLGDKPALIDASTGRVMTYAELVTAVQRAATGLAARGFQKGNVLALCSPNLPEYAVVFHAVTMLGGVITPVNPMSLASEMATQLKDSGARYVVTVPPLLGKIQEAVARTSVQQVFVLGDSDPALSFEALLAHDGPPPRVEIDPRTDLVLLPYSSGTSGLPKGVMLTHHNMVANLRQSAELLPLREDDVLIAALPFFHIAGLAVVLLLGLSRGTTLVLLPRFEMEPFLQALQKYRVTTALLVPPIMLGLAKSPLVSQYDLSALRQILGGAAPLSAEIEKACTARLGCVVGQAFGMTEVGGLLSANPLGSPERIKPGSAGLLAPNTECRVTDLETGADLGPNQHGELWLRGPQVMRGYLHQPEATSAALDAEGWLRTGDIGYVDEEGSLYVVDRLKELIKYKAWQVAPAELEAVLLTHPAVADAAVIPSRDEEAGEVPKALVVTRAQVTAEELLEFVAARVAPYKRIHKLAFIEQVPKTPSGKILRRLLVERERATAGPA